MGLVLITVRDIPIAVDIIFYIREIISLPK